MKVLAIDPGETTGYVLAEWGSGGVSGLVGIIDFDEFGTWHGIEELGDKVERGLLANVVIFVIEKYVIYPNRATAHIGNDLYTAREIGRLEWLAYSIGAQVVMHSASQAKSRWPWSRIVKHFPEFTNSKYPGHIWDALRHLLTFMEIGK